MSKTLRAITVAAAILLASGSSGTTMQVASEPSSDSRSTAPLSVLTYNVEGLPWPIASDRSTALASIAARLTALRRAGQQPHIVLLQEAFTSDAAAIARTAGYAHAAFGPDAGDRSPAAASRDDLAFLGGARWDRGEGWDKQLGSGLIILSDYPIVGIERLAFPDFACAGFDCLANKGAVIAQLRVPGHAVPVAVVDTHLNARRAAGVPVARSQQAYARQVGLLAGFVAAHVRADQAVLIGGDMNIGQDTARARRFFAAFDHARLSFVAPHLGGAQSALRLAAIPAGRGRRDLLASSMRRKDWVFAREPAGAAMTVARAQVPFGAERARPPLSDHVGYVIDYAAPAAVTLALNDAAMPRMAGLR